MSHGGGRLDARRDLPVQIVEIIAFEESYLVRILPSVKSLRFYSSRIVEESFTFSSFDRLHDRSDLLELS